MYRRANGQCRYRHVTAEEFEREQICALAEMPPEEAALRMPSSTVYRKRKAPSSVDNDDEEEEERYLNSSDTSAMFASAKPTVYLAPNVNSFRFGCQATVDARQSILSDRAHLLGGNNFRFLAAQPQTTVLPVAILQSAPLGVLATVRDVIGGYDTATPVVPATVAMGTSIIYPVAHWL